MVDQGNPAIRLHAFDKAKILLTRNELKQAHPYQCSTEELAIINMHKMGNTGPTQAQLFC